MATPAQLSEALRRADAAGDTQAATRLAKLYQESLATTRKAVLQDTGQGRLSSFGSNVGRGALSVIPGSIGGLGYLTGSDTLTETAEGIEGGINRALPVNPLYQGEFVQKAGQAIGQAGGTMATAGAGGLVGKGLSLARGVPAAGAIGLGAKTAALGGGALQGVREGGQAAERYGMTGGTAYARALLGGVTELGTEMLPFGTLAETGAARRLLGEALDKGIGGLVKTTGTEAAEEVAANTLGNIATAALAPEGVATPGILEGNLEAGALGAVGGATFAGVNALTPSGQPAPEAPVVPEDEFVTIESGGMRAVNIDPGLEESVAALTAEDVEDPLLTQTVETAVASVVDNQDVLPATAQALEEIANEPIETPPEPEQPVPVAETPQPTVIETPPEPEVVAEIPPTPETPIPTPDETSQEISPQDQIQEAGGPAPVESLPPEQAPAVEAEEGAAQRQGEGQEEIAPPVPEQQPAPAAPAAPPAPTRRPQAAERVQFRREGNLITGVYKGQDNLGRHVVDVNGQTEYVAKVPSPLEDSPITSISFRTEPVEQPAVAEVTETVEEVEPPVTQAITAPEQEAMRVLRDSNASLSPAAQAKWTPAAYQAAESYFASGDMADLAPLTTVQRRRAVQARLDVDEAARAEQEKIDRREEQRLAKREKKDRDFESRTTFLSADQMATGERKSRKAITPAQDAEYLAAVESGDTAKTQKMVDDAAKAAGYNQKVWRSDAEAFQEIKPEFPAIYTAKDRGLAEKFNLGPNGVVRQFYIKANKTATYEDIDISKSWRRNLKNVSMLRKQEVDELRSKGFDSAKGYLEDTQDLEIAVFDPDQIKSADAVTRDASGNIIPLSQRFNAESNNINFSLSADQMATGERGAQGITEEEANAIVADFKSKLVAPVAVEVVSGENLGTAPEFQSLRDAADRAGASVEDVGGWFDRTTGTAYIVFDQVRDAAHVRRVLIHEIVTHGGVGAVATTEEMRKIASIIKRVAPEINDFVEDNYPDARAETKIEEMLAKFSEQYRSADPANLREGWAKAWEDIKRILAAVIKRLGGDINAFDDLTLHRFYTNAVRNVSRNGVRRGRNGGVRTSVEPSADELRLSVEDQFAINQANFPGTPEAREAVRQEEELDDKITVESEARFQSWDERNNRFIPVSDKTLRSDADAFLDSMPLDEAFTRVMAEDVPGSLARGADGRYNLLLSGLLRRLTIAMDLTQDPYKVAQFRVQQKQAAQRFQEVGTGEGRALRSRAVANADIAPIAPILAAEKVLTDRSASTVNARFEGGEVAATDKLKKVNATASAQASEDLSEELASEGDPEKEYEEAEASIDRAQKTAEAIFNSLIRPVQAEGQREPDPVRALYNEHMKVPMNEETFVSRMVALGVERQTAETLHRTAADELRGRETSKRLRQKAREEAARLKVREIADKRASQLIYKTEERLRQGSKDLDKNASGDTINKAFRDQVKTPLPLTEFIARLQKLSVSTEVAERLFRTAEREANDLLIQEEQRLTQAERRRVEIAEKRASQLIYKTEERLRQGSKDLSSSQDGDTINKAFRDQVKAPLEWEAFRDRLDKLKVGEAVAQRLFRTAEREANDLQAVEDFRAARKADEVRAGIVAKDSPQLVKMINALRQKLYPGLNWKQIFEDLPDQQRERQKQIFTRLRLDERLKGLTQQEALDLTNELDKAWQRQRRRVFLKELERKGVLGEKAPADKAKVEKALPQLIRAINLGTFNSEMFREIIGQEYGFRQLTAAQARDLRQQAQEAWLQPEGVLRNQKMGKLLDSLQKATGSTVSELVNNYWVASVLSGLATQFDTYMSTLNGMGNNLIQAGTLIARGKGKEAFKAHLQWWAGLKQGALESLQILADGDYSVLKRFTTDLNKALEGQSNFRPVPLGESLWRNGNAWQKYGMAPVMMFTGRLMSAADHINNTATTYGAMAVARALHPEIYGNLSSFTAEERKNARAQAIKEVTGGAEPTTREEKATVSVRTREILGGALTPEQQEEASFIGDQAAYQNDPIGLFGSVYEALNAGVGTVERKLEKLATDPDTGSAFARGVYGVLAGGLRGITGTKFMRFGFNFGNDITQYIPGSYLLQKLALPVYGKEMSRSRQELLLGKNIFGLMTAATLAAMFLEKDDEEEGWHIEGNWSGLTPGQKKQLRTEGKEPLTMWKRAADGTMERVSYRSWPLSGIFVSVGSMNDQKRYDPKQWEKTGLAGHLMRAVTNGALQVKDITAMQGIAELFGASSFNTDPESDFIDRLLKLPIKFEGGFIPTLLKDIDAWEDPRNFKPETSLDELMRSVPILRREVADGRAMLNLLGEEVQMSRTPWRRVYSEAKGGKAYEVLGQLLSRGLSLPEPSTKRVVRYQGIEQTIEAIGPEAEWQFAKILGGKYKKFLENEGEALTGMTLERAQKRLRARAQDMGDQAERELVTTLNKAQ